jgi:2-keto-3-deoxy-L-rhamnonate aldolase RhmA
LSTNLKQKLVSRELTIGSWLTFSDPAVAEIMSKLGFDWLTIDMEHSGLSIDQAQQIIRVIDLCNVAPLVRVTENNPNLIKRFMDMGAHGVIVPMVNSKEEAERAVNAVKYSPVGTRGVGLNRAQNYSLGFEEYRCWNQENSIVIVQIEHINAVENLDSIMSVKGVDGFIIGPYDLSGSLNCPGDFENPEMQRALSIVQEKSVKNNYLRGYHVVPPDNQMVIEKINEGVQFIAFGVDFLFLREFSSKSLNQLKDHIKTIP